MKVLVSEEIESVCPGFVGAAVSAEVVNTKYNGTVANIRGLFL